MARGSVLDAGLLGMFIIAAAILGYFFYGVYSQVSTICLNTASELSAPDYATAYCNVLMPFIGNFVGVLPFVILGIGCLGVFFAWKVGAHPFFLPLSILFLAIIVVAYAYVGAAISDVFDSEFFLPAVTALPALRILATNVGLVVGFVGFLILIAQHGRGEVVNSGLPEG